MASRISDMAAPAVRLAKRLNLTIEGGKNKKGATKPVSIGAVREGGASNSSSIRIQGNAFGYVCVNGVPGWL